MVIQMVVVFKHKMFSENTLKSSKLRLKNSLKKSDKGKF